MGMFPGENVIFQISFRSLWLGFRLYCWAKLCLEVNASMPYCAQILCFFVFFFFPAVLPFEPKGSTIPNNTIKKRLIAFMSHLCAQILHSAFSSIAYIFICHTYIPAALTEAEHKLDGIVGD